MKSEEQLGSIPDQARTGYRSQFSEEELVDFLTDVIAGWMNDLYRSRYRAAIAKTLRLSAADSPDLRPSATTDR